MVEQSTMLAAGFVLSGASLNPTKAPTMDTFFALIFLGTFVAAIVAAIRPKTFIKLLRTPSRWKQAGILLSVSFVSFVAFGITASPPTPSSDTPDVATEVVQRGTDADAIIPTTENPQTTQTPTTTAASAAETYIVTNVVDGDTVDVLMNGETKRLRLIGVDTLETKDPRKPVQCFGKEASAFTTSKLLNQKVTLESDASQGELDKYSRLLRYVILSDGTNFNKLLISEGYAHEYTYRTAYKYQAEFKAAQADAEANKRGLWADDTCADNTTSASTTTSSAESTGSTPTSTESTTPQAETPTADSTTTTTTQDATIETPTPTAVCDCSDDKYNCADFSSHSAAQACFNYCMEQTGMDIHRLDGNNDGMACE
jgi:micrococcal nuclease